MEADIVSFCVFLRSASESSARDNDSA
jgi:hypothetical protein